MAEHRDISGLWSTSKKRVKNKLKFLSFRRDIYAKLIRPSGKVQLSISWSKNMSQRVCVYILERGVLGGYFWLGTAC